MNYIRHLNAFFSFVRCDKRLTSSHVSLYMALFQCWNINRFKNPFTIVREEVMKLSAIGSKNTYHKSLKELHDFGYIFYKVSTNKFYKGSVYIVVFENSNPVNMQQLNLFVSPGRKKRDPSAIPDQDSVQDEEPSGPKIDTVSVPNSVLDKKTTGPNIDTVPVPYLIPTGPKIDTVPVPYLGLLIKHKHINSKREREENSLSLTQKIFSKNKNLQESINQVAGRPNLGSDNPDFQKPSLQTVLAFFSENRYPAPEANKFFNHYQSNGWLVAGKTPMQDWKASAIKWMINSSNFQKAQKPNNGNHDQQDIDTGPGKDYSQPL